MSFFQLNTKNVSDVIGQNGQVVSPVHMTANQNYPVTAGRAKQQLNIAIAALPTASTVYSVTLLGETVSIVSSGTRATDVTALVAALNANPIIRGVFTASDNATTSVDIDANAFGTSETATVDDEGTGELTLTEPTPQAFATQIGIGLAVYFDGANGVTATNPNVGVDLDQLAGFSTLKDSAEQLVVGGSLTTNLYEDNEEVVATKNGIMILDTGDDAVEGGIAYVQDAAAAGSVIGKVYTSAGAGRVAAPIERLMWLGPNKLKINLGV